jgi:hypothetical protein
LKQGKELQAQMYLSHSDYNKEKNGERTLAGDRNREIKVRNAELVKNNELKVQYEIQQQLDCEYEYEFER